MEIKEKMKNEALERMKSLKLHENVICEFEKEDKLNKSFAFGILYWLTEEEKAEIMKTE